MKKLLALLLILVFSVTLTRQAFCPAVAEGAANEKTQDTAEEPKPLHRDFTLTAETEGFGELDTLLKELNLTLTVKSEGENFALLQLEAAADGVEPVVAVASVDEEGFAFTLPGLIDEFYFISIETAKELAPASEQVNVNGLLQGNTAETVGSIISEEEAAELVGRYGPIFAQLIEKADLTQTNGSYILAGLGEEKECRITTLGMKQDAWKVFLDELISTVKDDQQLLGLIEKTVQANSAAQVMEENGGEGTDPAEIVAQLPGILEQLAENTEAYAETLAAYTVTLAQDNEKFYAFKLTNNEGNGFGYESLGTISDGAGRKDALVLYFQSEDKEEGLILAENTLRGNEGDYDGTLSMEMLEFKADYSLSHEDGKPELEIEVNIGENKIDLRMEQEKDGQDFRVGYSGAESSFVANVKSAESTREIVLPDTEKTVLTSKEDLEEAGKKIAEALNQTELVMMLRSALPERTEEDWDEFSFDWTQYYEINQEMELQGSGTLYRDAGDEQETSEYTFDSSLALLYGGDDYGYGLLLRTGDSECFGFVEDANVYWMEEPVIMEEAEGLVTEVYSVDDQVELDFYLQLGDEWVMLEQMYVPVA